MRRATRARRASGDLFGLLRRPVLRLDRFPQHLECLGAQLGDAALGHGEEPGELLGGATLEEVARDDQAVTLGQQVHCVTKVRTHLTSLELFGRLRHGAVAEHVDEREIFVRLAEAIVEGQHHRAEHTVSERRQVSRTGSDLSRQLLHRRHASETAREPLLGRVGLPGQRPHRAGRPVRRPDCVEDRATDAARCELVERDSLARVEAVRRLHQAEHAGSDELAPVYVPREVHRHLHDDLLDEGQVRLDERAIRASGPPCVGSRLGRATGGGLPILGLCLRHLRPTPSTDVPAEIGTLSGDISTERCFALGVVWPISAAHRGWAPPVTDGSVTQC